MKQLTFSILVFLTCSCMAQNEGLKYITDSDVETGAEQIQTWAASLNGKKLGLVAHASSYIGEVHLVDSMLSSGLTLTKVFAPEHGFRGKASAGAVIKDEKDPKTGLPIISLYGANKKPKPDQLEGIDVMLFDLQDVGARFYTYLSTLHYVMEACAEARIPLIVLDRPNPNGYYTAGPILEKEHKSFVGMHPIPIVHGNTLGEMAMMINGEGWLTGNLVCDLEVVKVKGYQHNFIYRLPRKPSPNLPNTAAIYLYPSLCLFEGTTVSVGRGTKEPFQLYGAPYLNGSYAFIPVDFPGAKNPKWKKELCYGQHLGGYAQNQLENPVGMNLTWLVAAYNHHMAMKVEKPFFNKFFTKLAGTEDLQQRIEGGQSAEQILQVWDAQIKDYNEMRQKYLLYP